MLGAVITFAVLLSAYIVMIYHFSRKPYTPSTTNPASDNYLLVPMYIYPTVANMKYYYMVHESAQPMKVIINPNNGEDALTLPNSDWKKALEVIKDKETLGYIYTLYGDRDLSILMSNVDGYIDNGWGVSGFFFDETLATDNKVDYYAQIAEYVQSKGMSVVFNPGTESAESMRELCDISVEFEGNANTFDSMSFAAQNREGVACIVHGALEFDPHLFNNMKAAFQGVYMIETDAYNYLPAYWDDLVI